MEWTTALLIFVAMAVLILHRDTTARMGRMERKLNLLLRHAGIDPSLRLPLSERVQALARDPAQKITAIKVYREETGAGLAEAKAAVEAFINGL
jgi:hypothetical protein